MALSLNELSPEMLQIIKDAIRGELAHLWTSLPCEVESYDPEAVTISAQPTIKIPIRNKYGTVELLQLPLLEDVPVMFACAGGFTITHPINKGDECFVSFASRNIDIWWQSGGIQNPFDTRKHDLSDGFAFFRPQSQAKKISDISTTDLEIRNDANTCKIQITPGGVINFIGAKSVFHHPVEMMEGVKTYGELTNNDVDVGSNHPHLGVQSGNGESGPPKP